MVIATSRINCVVVSKIVEAGGLKSISETPDTAIIALNKDVPGVIVLDGGMNNGDCDGLMPTISALRNTIGRSTPSVIFLSTKACTPEDTAFARIIDIVVAKPITPERLQPTIEKLIAQRTMSR